MGVISPCGWVSVHLVAGCYFAMWRVSFRPVAGYHFTLWLGVISQCGRVSFRSVAGYHFSLLDLHDQLAPLWQGTICPPWIAISVTEREQQQHIEQLIQEIVSCQISTDSRKPRLL